MPRPFWWTSLDSGFRVATVLLGFDRQGWITVFAALLLALMMLLANDTHVEILESAVLLAPAIGTKVHVN
jgi:hypothetical protein